MKKIFLSIVLSSLSLSSFAQNTFSGGNVIINTPNNLNTFNNMNNRVIGDSNGVRNYQFTDRSGNQTNIVSPVPGLYIQQPQWMQNVAETNQDLKEDNDVEQRREAQAPQAPALQANPAPNPTPNQAINNSLPNNPSMPINNPQQVNKPTKAKRVGQVPVTPAVVNQTSISSWNTSTLDEFKAKGQERLQQSYQEFIYQSHN